MAANYTVFTVSAEEEEEIVRDSVEGVEVALRSAAKAGVRKVVLTSSVVTLPLSEPGGPLVTEADWLDDSAVPYFRAVDARDVAWGQILAAKRDVEGRFILCDQQPSFVEFTRVMHDIDRKVPAAPWVLPDFVLRSLPWFDAMNAKVLGSQRFITPETVAAIKGRVYNVSSARAKAELGWEPTFPFRKSLEDTMLAIRGLRRNEGKRRMA